MSLFEGLGHAIAGAGTAAQDYNHRMLQVWEKNRETVTNHLKDFLTNTSLSPERYNEVAAFIPKLSKLSPGAPGQLALLDKITQATMIHPELGSKLDPPPPTPPKPIPGATGPGEVAGNPDNNWLGQFLKQATAPGAQSMWDGATLPQVQAPPPGPSFAQPSVMPPPPMPVQAGPVGAVPGTSPVEAGAPQLPQIAAPPTPQISPASAPGGTATQSFQFPNIADMMNSTFKGETTPARAKLLTAGMQAQFGHQAGLAEKAQLHQLDQKLAAEKIKAKFDQLAEQGIDVNALPQQTKMALVASIINDKALTGIQYLPSEDGNLGKPINSVKTTDENGQPVIRQTFANGTHVDLPQPVSMRVGTDSSTGQNVRINPFGESGTATGTAPIGASNFSKPVDAIVDGKVQRVMVNSQGKLPDGTVPTLVSPLNVRNTNSSSSEPTLSGGTQRTTTTGKSITGVPGQASSAASAQSTASVRPTVTASPTNGSWWKPVSKANPQVGDFTRKFDPVNDAIDAKIKQAISSNQTKVTGNEAIQQATAKRMADLGLEFGKKIPNSFLERAGLAKKILTHMDEVENAINFADKAGAIGVVASRWNNLLANKIGKDESATFTQEALDQAKAKYKKDNGKEMPANEQAMFKTGISKAFSTLSTNQSFLESAVSMAHGGARGGSSVPIIDKWKDALSATDAQTLRSKLKVARSWMEGYASLGDSVGQNKLKEIEAAPAGTNEKSMTTEQKREAVRKALSEAK